MINRRNFLKGMLAVPTVVLSTTSVKSATSKTITSTVSSSSSVSVSSSTATTPWDGYMYYQWKSMDMVTPLPWGGAKIGEQLND